MMIQNYSDVSYHGLNQQQCDVISEKVSTPTIEHIDNASGNEMNSHQGYKDVLLGLMIDAYENSHQHAIDTITHDETCNGATIKNANVQLSKDACLNTFVVQYGYLGQYNDVLTRYYHPFS